MLRICEASTPLRMTEYKESSRSTEDKQLSSCLRCSKQEPQGDQSQTCDGTRRSVVRRRRFAIRARNIDAQRLFAGMVPRKFFSFPIFSLSLEKCDAGLDLSPIGRHRFLEGCAVRASQDSRVVSTPD